MIASQTHDVALDINYQGEKKRKREKVIKDVIQKDQKAKHSSNKISSTFNVVESNVKDDDWASF